MRIKLWLTLAAGVLAILPAAAAANTTKSGEQAIPTAWAAQTISGKITMVVPKDNLVVVTDQSGTPFDVKITRSTAIRSGDTRLTLDQLNGDIDHSVSVHFVPARSGDIARSIRISQ